MTSSVKMGALVHRSAEPSRQREIDSTYLGWIRKLIRDNPQYRVVFDEAGSLDEIYQLLRSALINGQAMTVHQLYVLVAMIQSSIKFQGGDKQAVNVADVVRALSRRGQGHVTQSIVQSVLQQEGPAAAPEGDGKFGAVPVSHVDPRVYTWLAEFGEGLKHPGTRPSRTQVTYLDGTRHYYDGQIHLVQAPASGEVIFDNIWHSEADPSELYVIRSGRAERITPVKVNNGQTHTYYRDRQGRLYSNTGIPGAFDERRGVWSFSLAAWGRGEFLDLHQPPVREVIVEERIDGTKWTPKDPR